MLIFKNNFKNYKFRNVHSIKDYFDIGIGKTPPRKELQWFSKSSDDIPWISISDMNSSNIFISSSLEKLTYSGIKKYNVKTIPQNTVLLSFKLTIGRVAITDNNITTTNEAIAHFKTDKKYLVGYLYCYLKNFNFQLLGSTSSIATALNSKIIKTMPFYMPADEELMKFYNLTNPFFELIRINQRQNNRLINIKKLILPKLLSGEIDISNIELGELL